jgi:hypothetical protein
MGPGSSLELEVGVFSCKGIHRSFFDGSKNVGGKGRKGLDSMLPILPFNQLPDIFYITDDGNEREKGSAVPSP